MRKILLVSLTAAGLSTAAWAASAEYDFKDPKGVGHVQFKLVAPLETITGTGAGLSGSVTFDPDQPAALKGKVTLAVTSLQVPNAMMKQHLVGAPWMDAASFPEITFEIAEAKNAQTDGNATTADIAGKLAVKGITKDVTVPVKVTYLKDKMKERSGQDGDLITVVGSFAISRRDYGINPGQREDKVSDSVQLTLNLVGSAPRH